MGKKSLEKFPLALDPDIVQLMNVGEGGEKWSDRRTERQKQRE